MITVSGILTQADLDDVRAEAEQLVWQDGQSTAGGAARQVKRNLQADMRSRAGARLATRLQQALESHPVIQAAAWPRRFSKLLLSRTVKGGGYGLHVDNALMGVAGRKMRSDLSFTLFLSDPVSYDGGELEVEQPGGTQCFKLAPGDLVLYPSSSLHRVAPVTGGERLACVGWIESLVRDSAQREILFDLENLRADLLREMAADDVRLLTLSKTIANLLRQWAEP